MPVGKIIKLRKVNLNIVGLKRACAVTFREIKENGSFDSLTSLNLILFLNKI